MSTFLPVFALIERVFSKAASPPPVIEVSYSESVDSDYHSLQQIPVIIIHFFIEL